MNGGAVCAPTLGQQAAITGGTALAHISALGLLALLVVTQPPTRLPVPISVNLVAPPPKPDSEAVRGSSAAGTAGASTPSANAQPATVASAAASAAPPATKPLVQPAAKSDAVAAASKPPKPQAQPKPKPEARPQAKAPPLVHATAKPKAEAVPKKSQTQTYNIAPPSDAGLAPAAPVQTAKSATPGSSMGNSGGMHSGVGAASSGNATQHVGIGEAGAGDQQPSPTYQPRPAYPEFARRLGHEGRVVIRVQVLSSGTVAAAIIHQSSGSAALDEAALATIKRWRFRPAQRAGQAVNATLNVPITFKLQQGG